MLSPKRTKFRKFHKGRIHALKGNQKTITLGKFGIQAMTSARISSRVLEAARRAMTRKLKRSGQIWIKVFPDIGVSRKPAEVRMGKGKGALDHWVCRVQRGQILFELSGVSSALAKQAASLVYNKLPIPVKFIERL
jgi:large subunit ribosomal protein L16